MGHALHQLFFLKPSLSESFVIQRKDNFAPTGLTLNTLPGTFN